MKNQFLLLAFICFSFSAFAQINFHASGGLLYNDGLYNHPGVFHKRSLPQFSYMVGAGTSYDLRPFNFGLNLQFRQVAWNVEMGGNGLSGIRFKAHYATLNPTIEYRPINWLGVIIGGYYSQNLFLRKWNSEEMRFFSPEKDSFESKDYGAETGIRFYVLNRYSIGFHYSLGLNHLDDLLLIDEDGNLINWYRKARNQSYQLKFTYHFKSTKT